VEERFIERKFEAIDKRQDKHEERVDGIERNVAEKFDELQMYATRTYGLADKQVELLRELRTHMDSRFDRVSERFGRLDDRVSAVHTDVAELEIATKAIQETQAEHGKRFDTIEAMLRQLIERSERGKE
jgi:hypothetical protein